MCGSAPAWENSRKAKIAAAIAASQQITFDVMRRSNGEKKGVDESVTKIRAWDMLEALGMPKHLGLLEEKLDPNQPRQ